MVEKRDFDIIFSNPIEWEKFRNQTILVTAATGRLGIYILESLVKADIDFNLNMRVVALARNHEKLVKMLGETLKLPNVIELNQDITDPITIDGNVDYIFHTAGLASPSDFTYNPVGTLWGHVMGTHNVLELAKNKKTKRVFYVSTVEIYGNWDSDKEICEDDMEPIHCDIARSCYPEAKRLCETMLASYQAQYGVNYAGVRLCHTFGPGISLTDGRAFSEFLGNAAKGENIVLHSDGSAVRTYTYVADAVGAMLLVCTKGEDNQFYNVASLDNEISIRDLAELIAKLDPTGHTKVEYDNKDTKGLKYLPFKLGIMNVDKAKKLGWTSKVSTADAFRYTFEYILQNEKL